MGKNQSLNLPFRLVLGSTSKYRGALLSQLGYPFEAINPGVDEDKVKNKLSSPEEIATILSQLKAEAAFAKRPDCCVIGSDQVCSINGMLFDKPLTIEMATQQLAQLQGKSHELLTAVTIISPLGIETFVNKTTLHMRSLNFKEIHSYVTQDLPLDCAGSYKLESMGIKLFHKIDMTDHTAIIGLPLIELSSRLIKLGFPI